MIDWIKSAKLNNCSVEELKVWFDKYPCTRKHIIAICDGVGCGKEREIRYRTYRDLCHSCGHKTEKFCENQRQAQLGKTHSDETKEKIGRASLERMPSHETREKQRQGVLKYYAEMSDTKKQIVGHHIAYDFDRPEAFVVKITKSFHSSIHHPKGIPLTEHGYSLID